MLASEELNEEGCYPFSTTEKDGLVQIKLGDLLSAIILDIRNNTDKSRISARFHTTIARIIVTLCQAISEKTGIRQVALSGGVFQNRLLLKKTVDLLEARWFKVITHRQVPCTDGGISLGQAVAANFSQ